MPPAPSTPDVRGLPLARTAAVPGNGDTSRPAVRHPPQPDPAVLHDHPEPLDVVTTVVRVIAAGADEFHAARRSGLTARTRHGNPPRGEGKTREKCRRNESQAASSAGPATCSATSFSTYAF